LIFTEDNHTAIQRDGRVTDGRGLIPRALIYLLLIITPLPKGSVPGWAITLMHILTLMALTSFFIEKILRWNGKWTQTPLTKSITAILLLSLISALNSVHRGLSFWALAELINYIAIYFLVTQIFEQRKHRQMLVFTIVGVATFLAVFGLFKWAGANPFPWWAYENRQGPQDLLTSTYFNHNHIAGYLEMAIPLLLGVLASGLKRGQFVLFSILLTFLVTALILSLSRGGWIGTLIGSVFFVLVIMRATQSLNSKKILLICITAILLFGVIALSSETTVERVLTIEQKEKDDSFQSRVTAWKGILNLILDYPLLGSGPGTFSTIFTQYQPPGFWDRFVNAHNDYLQFTAELGVFWIPIVIWGLFLLFRIGFQKLPNHSGLTLGTTAGAMAGIVAIMVHSISDFNLHIPANALLFTVIMAIAASPALKHGR